MKGLFSIVFAIIIVGVALAILQWAMVAVAVVAAIVIVLFILTAIYEARPEVRIRRVEEERVAAENAKIATQRAMERAEQAKESARILEIERATFRDSDSQDRPYQYKIGKHANESLAIRYGIANQVRKTKEYWYHGRGGERLRNADRDKVYYEPSNAIRLQKVREVGDARYEVLLTDFRERRAIAVIEPGTEYVKTFLPLDEQWFSQNADLELTLKGNGTFNLKELARIHVDKAVGRKG
jgi:hypothetical protein